MRAGTQRQNRTTQGMAIIACSQPDGQDEDDEE